MTVWTAEFHLYLEDGRIFPEGNPGDTATAEFLASASGEQGIIDPHICSANGGNEFNLYRKAVLRMEQQGIF